MSNIDQLVGRFLQEVPREPQKHFHRYYLRKNVPKDKKYVSEAVVGMIPASSDVAIFATQIRGNRSDQPPASVEEYYQALLSAHLPQRVLDNEQLYNVKPDKEGVVLESEFEAARLISTMLQFPIVAAVLYRADQSTELLAQLFTLLPLRPSDGFSRLNARIRERLARP